MTDNIIHLPLRYNARLGERRQTLSDQLRATTRLPKSDRPIMASNLGRMAARLNEGNSIAVVKSMFEIAWPGDSTKWAKRKRLVRTPGEELGDPEDYGSYEAAGASYLHLAHSIARLTLPNEKQENLEAEQERRVAELLWGTSLRPGASLADETTVDARNLMVQLASTVGAQVSETGIQKLWETLQDCPFRRINVEGVIKAKNFRFGADLITIPGADGSPLNFHNAQEFGVWAQTVGWSRPKIFIGWLLRRFSVDLLVPPEDIRLRVDQDENPDNPDLKKLEEWADEWSNLGSNGKKEKLPTHYFDGDLGHGWTQVEFDVVYSVYARAFPDSSNGIDITLQFEDCADDEYRTLMLPSVCIDKLKWSGVLRPYLEMYAYNYSRTYSEHGVFDGFYKHFIPGEIEHFIPDQLEGQFAFWSRDPHTGNIFSLSKRIRAGNLLGVVSFPGGDNTPDPPEEIALSKMAEGESAGILLGTSQVQFVSVLTEAVGAPVPCHANCLAASLLRNSISGDEEERLSNLMRENAKGIAEQGLEFFNGVIDLYRNSIK